MKKLLSVMIILTMCLPIVAQRITEEQALQKAQTFMQGKVMNDANGRKNAPAKSRAMKRVAQATGSDALYMFNVGDNGGYVIVSGDERTDEILGYSTEGNIDPQQMPENMRAWIEGYEKQIRSLPPSAKKAPSNVPLHPAVEPLITAKWNQGAPYNLKCPMQIPDGGTEPVQCVTGCVATALAQIMYYHKWPKSMTTAIPAYDYGYVGWDEETETNIYKYHEDALPPTTFNWDLMKDSYDYKDTGAEAQAVAQLMRYCGQAVCMNYGPGASGAANSPWPIIRYFGYGKEAKYVGRTYDHYSNKAWDELIYGELAARRPVWYDGGSMMGGHSFVCDGYDGNGHYHINWGWGGGSNGYFLLSLLNDGGGDSGFNMQQNAVVGIQPAASYAESHYDEEKVVYPSLNYETFANGNVAGLNAYYWTATDSYMVIDCAIGILDNDGSVEVLTPLLDKQLLDNRTNINVDTRFFESYYEMTSQESPATAIPNLPDGTYKLVALWKEINETQWHYQGESLGDYGYAELTVKGKQMTFEAKYHSYRDDYNYTATIEPVGSLVVGEQQRIAIHCVNKGVACQEPLLLYASQTAEKGEYTAMTMLFMDEGAEETVYMNFMPNQKGTYHIWVVAENGIDEVVAQADVQIVNPIGLSINDESVRYDWTDNTMKLSVDNNNEFAYDGDVAVRIWQRDQDENEAQEYRQHVHIKPGESQNVIIQCGEWNRDRLYYGKLLYCKNPNSNVLSEYNSVYLYLRPMSHENFEAGGISYSIVDKNNHVVMATDVNYDAPAKLKVPVTVTSPEKGTTYTVQGIDANFCPFADVEEVTVSEGITTIDMHAFNNCPQLQKLTLPSTLRTIGACMISNCPNLKVICSMAEEAPLTVDYGVARDYQLNTSSQADYDRIKLYVPDGAWESYRQEWPHFSHVYVKDFNEQVGDVNGDGVVNVTDVTAIINIILGKK